MDSFEWLGKVSPDPLVEQVVSKGFALPERSWQVSKVGHNGRTYEVTTTNGLRIQVEYECQTGRFDDQYETDHCWTLSLDGRKTSKFWKFNDGRLEGFTGVRLLFERVDRVFLPQIQAEARQKYQQEQERKAAEEQRKRNDILKRL